MKGNEHMSNFLARLRTAWFMAEKCEDILASGKAYVEALEAEVERLQGETSANQAMLFVAGRAVKELKTEVERLRGPVADNFQRMVKGTLARAETAEAEVEWLTGEQRTLGGVINDYIDKVKAERVRVAELETANTQLVKELVIEERICTHRGKVIMNYSREVEWLDALVQAAYLDGWENHRLETLDDNDTSGQKSWDESDSFRVLNGQPVQWFPALAEEI